MCVFTVGTVSDDSCCQVAPSLWCWLLTDGTIDSGSEVSRMQKLSFVLKEPGISKGSLLIKLE